MDDPHALAEMLRQVADNVEAFPDQGAQVMRLRHIIRTCYRIAARSEFETPDSDTCARSIIAFIGSMMEREFTTLLAEQRDTGRNPWAGVERRHAAESAQ